MKKIFYGLLVISFSVSAAYKDDPYEKFSIKDNFTDSSRIKWVAVDDVKKACDDLRVKSGAKPFKFKPQACSTWSKNFFRQDQCLIITSKNPTGWTLGHEVRHCFQGDYHPY